MIFIDEMKNLKIYRKPVFLPYEDKDKKHGSILYLLTPNYQSSMKQMKLHYTINRHYFESYYLEKDITKFIGNSAALKEAADTNDTASIYKDFDFDSFTAYALKGDCVESTDFSETIDEELEKLQAPSGSYSVYTHTVDNEEPVMIGKIIVQVVQYTDYKAMYKWTEFADFDPIEDEEETTLENVPVYSSWGNPHFRIIDTENALVEGYFSDEDDIYYNKEAFDKGDINLCFITGLSGSGKTTMAEGIESERIELDDVMMNWHFDDKNLKEYGDLIYSYFQGPGKVFRIQPDQKPSDIIAEYKGNDFFSDNTKAFVAYAKSYAKSHKKVKFVIDGVQLFAFIAPDDLVNYAVYIKGTGTTKSLFRSLVRDVKLGNKVSEKFQWAAAKLKSAPEYYATYEKQVQKYRDFYRNKVVNMSEMFLSEESVYNDFVITNAAALYEIETTLLEISKADETKNDKLEPVFVVTTFTDSLMGNIIQHATKQNYTHALLSLDSSLKNMYSFDFFKTVKNSDGVSRKYNGFIVDNIDRYVNMKTNDMKVYCLMCTSKVKKSIESALNWYKNNIKNTKYSFANLIDYFTKSPRVSSNHDLKMICSEFVDVILKTSGVDISGHASNITTPSDLGTYKNRNNFFKVFEGRANEYNPQDTDDQIEFMKHNVPYAQLNAKKRKADIIAEADDSASETDGLDLATRLKYKVRSIKMGGKKGLYKLNKQIRDLQRSLPSAEDIQNSVSVGPSATSEGASVLRILEAMDASQLYYMIENEFIIFNEASPANETQLRRMLYADRIKNQKQVIAIYNKVKTENPFIRFTFPVISRYDNRNVFYDLSYYNEVFFRNVGTLTPLRTLGLYKDLLNKILNKRNIPASYTKKTIFIPVLDWDSDPKTRTWIFREGVNPLSVLYQMMTTDLSGLKNIFGDTNIVFTSNNTYFKINFSTLTKEEEKTLAGTFKRFIQKMKKGEVFDQNEVDEHPDEESTKVIATNILDKIEKAQGVDMSKHYASINKYATLPLIAPSNGMPSAVGVSAPKIQAPFLASPKQYTKEFKNTEKNEAIVKDEIKTATKSDVEKTTTSIAVSPEAKEQKVKDKEAVEMQKDRLTRRITKVAAASKNTDDAMDTLSSEEDYEIKQLIMNLAVEEDPTVKINKARAARMMQLNDNIKEKEIKGTKIKDLLNADSQEDVNRPLPETTIQVDSPFQDQWSNLKYINFDKTYDINKDIMKMLMALADKQYPISMRDITVEDASTAEDYIDKYHIEFEDFRGKRFTVNLDIPKFKDNKYLILRGNKKTIQNQYFNMPILKTEQDTVQIISNYNKIFVRRFGNTAGKTIAYVDRIVKAARKYKGNIIKFTTGDNSKLSESYDMPIDYIDLGSIYNTIEVKNKRIYYFNQKILREKYGNKIDDTQGFPYAVNNTGEILYYNRSESSQMPLSMLIANQLSLEDKNFEEAYNASNAARRYVYSQASILNMHVPLIIVCAYSEGLTTVLKKANIGYELLEKLGSKDRHDPMKDWIKFSDGYLLYTINYESSLLLNGLKEIDTEAYSINDINTKRIYTEMLDNYGGRIKADGIENFYECMLDPITLEVLEHYKLPTDYIELMVYANHLLVDNKYISHGDSSSRRIRRNELIAVKVYKALFNDAYARYAYSLRNNIAGAAFSVKESAVIDKFMTDTISSDLSVINCLNDVETANAVTTKGESGMNSARAYTLDKRTYDASMLNLLGLSTGFAGNVGVTRQATINMNIDTERGYIKSIEGDTSKMNVANTMTITEALNPMGATRDDPMRTAMTFIQTAKHQVRTELSDPLLVTNGADEVLPYLVTDIFCKKAELDGKVIELNMENINNGYMIVEYVSGKRDYINLSEQIEKNSDGGFYVNTKLVTDLQIGNKFKAGDVLAYEKDSFSKNKLGESDKLTYNVGKLAKVAIINSDDNFEDSAMVTSKLAEALATSVIIQESRILSKDTNIYNVASVGQSVQQEDILFETQTAYEEEDVNALLKSLAGDAETISRLNRRPVRSPVTGVIAGIKLYRTCEIEEMSPSLQKLFKSYEANAKKLQKHLLDLGINDPTLTPSTKKLPPIGKLKNSPDSVLIEFYVRYHDIMAVGDKLTYWSANKGVVHSIVDSKEAPYTDFRPEEEISAFSGITSINKRQVASNIIVGSLNKLCIELGRQCRKKLGIPFYENELNM